MGSPGPVTGFPLPLPQYVLPVLYRRDCLSADGQNTDGMSEV